jgi:hypothetical protein
MNHKESCQVFEHVEGGVIFSKILNSLHRYKIFFKTLVPKISLFALTKGDTVYDRR